VPKGLWHDGLMFSARSDSDPTQPPSTPLLRPPVRAWALSEWALVPLRLFIGVTFTFAGLQKLANPNFFNAKSPISIQAELLASVHTSPIHAVLTHLVGIAKPIGLLIAFGELAIGVGTLLGLWTRIAAIGGLILSLTLFLTVSFHASPYFTGADIVFVFAWMPFIVAGGGTRLSLDGWIAHRSAARAGLTAPELVPIPFATVQAICGNYHEGLCSARGDLACDAAACPVLLGGRAPLLTRGALDTIDRRSLVVGSTTVAAVGAAVLLFGGAAADTGKIIGDAPKPTSSTGLTLSTSTTTTTTPVTITSGGPTTTTPASTEPTPKGKLLGPASDVPDNQAASFTIPVSNDPGIVIHSDSGEFVAYNAVCPHMGCTVGYSRTNKIIVCPCHGSEFKVSNGEVIVGPAPHGLAKLKVTEGSNGNLYLQ
jgi:thiosulfate dehydrogenase [quinone] large subunit